SSGFLSPPAPRGSSRPGPLFLMVELPTLRAGLPALFLFRCQRDREHGSWSCLIDDVGFRLSRFVLGRDDGTETNYRIDWIAAPSILLGRSRVPVCTITASASMPLSANPAVGTLNEYSVPSH